MVPTKVVKQCRDTSRAQLGQEVISLAVLDFLTLDKGGVAKRTMTSVGCYLCEDTFPSYRREKRSSSSLIFMSSAEFLHWDRAARYR